MFTKRPWVCMNDKAQTSVLFVDQSGVMGGAELSLFDIVMSRPAGDQVVVFDDGPFPKKLRDSGADVHVVPLSVGVSKSSGVMGQVLALPKVLRVVRRVAKLARQHDLIYANTQKAAVVGAIAARFSKRPMIWHLRDMLGSEHFSDANLKLVITLTNRLGHKVIANSNATAEAYQQAGGQLPVTVVHNGIDPAPFEGLGQLNITELRGELGLPGDTTLVGNFGRLTPWKGQHILLDAMESDSLADCHAVMVGDPLFTEKDRQYAESLKARSKAGPLASRVHWLGHREDVPKLMRACDIVAHTATSPEPFGRVIVEGMLAGRPVIATDAGGAKEIITNGQIGLLTPPGNAELLGEAIANLRNDQGFRKELGEAGRQSALDRFSIRSVLERIEIMINQSV